MTPANSSKIAFLKASCKPEGKMKGSEENKPSPWNAAVMVLLFFSGGNVGP